MFFLARFPTIPICVCAGRVNCPFQSNVTFAAWGKLPYSTGLIAAVPPGHVPRK